MSELKAAKVLDSLPSDPDCEAIKFVGIPRGVQAMICIEGSDHLFTVINPGDGRDPYIVSRGPAVEMLTNACTGEKKMIDRTEDKVLWERKNSNSQGKKITLCMDSYSKQLEIIIKTPLENAECTFTEGQFFEMAMAGAAYFGKEIALTDIIQPCPNCHSKLFEFYKCNGMSNGDPVVFIQKECRVCGLRGPRGLSEADADEYWDKVFNKSNKHITIEEELARR